MHEVQTRNDAGATPTHETIAAAFKAAEEDLSIWKISWTDATTGERVRLVRCRDDEQLLIWRYDPIVVPLTKGDEE